GLGACGWTNSNSDYIVAMSASRYTSSVCGKMVSITANGKTHTAEVVDECPGCSANSLDMSPTLFSYFADESVGVISIEW
ncbi:barwin-like endoglucanase, partial [Clavulina sp. PMI_390]